MAVLPLYAASQFSWERPTDVEDTPAPLTIHECIFGWKKEAARVLPLCSSNCMGFAIWLIVAIVHTL